MTASAFPRIVTRDAPSADLRRASVRVDRCLTELRRGRAVRITDTEGGVVAAAVETLAPELLCRLSTTGARLAIAVTEERARALAFGNLQLALMKNPEAGEVIEGTGGLRKMRFADKRRGKGKRGGANQRTGRPILPSRRSTSDRSHRK